MCASVLVCVSVCVCRVLQGLTGAPNSYKLPKEMRFPSVPSQSLKGEGVKQGEGVVLCSFGAATL